MQRVIVVLDYTDHSREDSSGQVISPIQKSLTTYNTHNRQTSMLPAGFEPAIPAGEQTQTHPLEERPRGTAAELSVTRITSNFHP
jgi:hypothetical protein